MDSWIDGCFQRLKHPLRWSSNWNTWRERLAIILLAVCAGILALAGRGLGWAAQLLLGGLWVVVLAFLCRRGWLKLFGPVLFYDLVQTSRRQRYRIIRVLYASFLLFLLSWIYLVWFVEQRNTGGLAAAVMPNFAGSFFHTFMLVQAVLVVILTPAYTAGTIADEKEQNTLELLLATDLRSREIVLSKLISRLLQISFLMLVGLPILSFLQFLGGIDPNLILAGFVATAATAASLAGLSIYHSTVIQRTRDAIIVTYLVALAYLLVSGAMWLLLVPSLGIANWPSTTTWTSPVTVQDVVEWANAGNVVAVCIQLMAGVSRQVPLDSLVPGLLRDYVLFHGIVAIGGSLWAIGRLRTAALAEKTKKSRKTKTSTDERSRPTIGEQPMIWKELWIEGSFRFHWLTRIAIIILVAATLTPAVYIFYESYRRPWSSLSEDLYRWGQATGTLVSCLLLCAVAVRASGTISGERNRKTYDDLITTLLTSHEILLAKGLGSIFAVRWGWLWLGLIWFVSFIWGDMLFIGIFLHGAIWCIYAAVAALVGLYCSLVCRNSLRATLWSLIWMIFLGGGHWLVMSLICYFPMAAMHVPFRLYEWIYKLEAGLTPPVVLISFTLGVSHNLQRSQREFHEVLGHYCVFGILCWTVLAALLWRATCNRFNIVTGRSSSSTRRPF